MSRWQGDIDWSRLRREGANFAYIKATDGGDHLDPMFMKNWQGAEQAGIKRGAYHFFYWCRYASEQADWFIRNVPRSEGALPPVIDVEWNHQSSCKRRPSRAQVLERYLEDVNALAHHLSQTEGRVGVARGLRARLADWNQNNPEQPIVVKMPDVWKKVREMGKDRIDRIADNSPKALRQQMREMAAEAR